MWAVEMLCQTWPIAGAPEGSGRNDSPHKCARLN
jgi:hypothetical protein